MALPPTISIERFLAAKPSDELFDLADQIEELIATRAWGTLQEVVEEGRENLRRQLELGPVHEQAEYARHMGFLNGITVPADIARAVMKAAADRRLELEREAAEAKEQREQVAEGV